MPHKKQPPWKGLRGGGKKGEGPVHSTTHVAIIISRCLVGEKVPQIIAFGDVRKCDDKENVKRNIISLLKKDKLEEVRVTEKDLLVEKLRKGKNVKLCSG